MKNMLLNTSENYFVDVLNICPFDLKSFNRNKYVYIYIIATYY